MHFNIWLENLTTQPKPEELIKYSGHIQTLVKLEGQKSTAKKLRMSQAKLSHQLELLRELGRPVEAHFKD